MNQSSHHHDAASHGAAGPDGKTGTLLADLLASLAAIGRSIQNYYTTAFDPQARYVVAEWALRTVFAGEAMLVHDFQTDARFAQVNPFEHKVQEAGLRSALLVPLDSGGRAIGALVATSLRPETYTEAHLDAAKQVAALIGPFVENVVLLQWARCSRPWSCSCSCTTGAPP